MKGLYRDHPEYEFLLFVATALILLALSWAVMAKVENVENEIVAKAEKRLRFGSEIEQSPIPEEERATIIEQSRHRWNYLRIPVFAVIMSALVAGVLNARVFGCSARLQ